MATITYCKGLPTPDQEMNSLGFTDLEMFLSSFVPVFHKAACETVDHLLSESSFNKSNWNTYLQQRYGILKRHANGVISNALGLVDSARECRQMPVTPVTRDMNFGCIGIDMNPGSIGWADCDGEGNLKAKGQIPLQMGLPRGKQDAQIVDACLQLATLAATTKSPVVCEQLDFSTKKEQLRERGNKYARMLSSWAYSRCYELLGSILSNRGIELVTTNPAYTSVIGLVKFARMYGLASDEAAAFAVARRGMQLSERLPSAITAYLSVNDQKQVWHWWNKLNTLLKQSSISRRHDYYAISRLGVSGQPYEDGSQQRRLRQLL